MPLSAVFKNYKPTFNTSDEVLKVSDLGVKVNSQFSLSAIDFELKRGEGIALVGGNGEGKSTLIRLLAGLTNASQGSVIVCGYSAKKWSKVSKHIGYVQQFKELPEGLTVKEYLTHQLRLRRASQHRYEELIKLAKLENLQPTLVTRLSGGNQRKVQILSVIGHKPDLLILDEPTNGLDAPARDAILSFIAQLKSTGLSVVVASHHLDEIKKLADRVLMLHRGKQILLTSVTEFMGTSSTNCLELFPYKKNSNAKNILDSLNKWSEAQDCSFSIEKTELCIRLHCSNEHMDYLPPVVTHLSQDGVRLSEIRYRKQTLTEIMYNFTNNTLNKDQT